MVKLVSWILQIGFSKAINEVLTHYDRKETVKIDIHFNRVCCLYRDQHQFFVLMMRLYTKNVLVEKIFVLFISTLSC